MGLLSKIKNLGKKLLGGVAKVLSNKWVQRALMVATLVVPVVGMATSGWTAAAGQGLGAQIGGALGNVAKGVAQMVVKTVTAPIKMLASGGAQVAGKIGAEGLASSLGSFAKDVGGLSNSIFGEVSKDSLGQIMNKMGIGGSEAAAIPGGASALQAAENPAFAGSDAMGQAANANIDAGLASNMDKLSASATAASAPASGGGVLGFIKNNPTAAMMGFNAVASATSPDELDIVKARAKENDKQLQKQNAEWNSFGSAVAQQQSAAQNSAQGQTTPPSQFDWKTRAEQARDFIYGNDPILKRPTFGAA